MSPSVSYIFNSFITLILIPTKLSPFTMDPDTEVEFRCILFILYKSGRIERLLGNSVVPASFDPATGVTSKDAVIDPATNLSARLYLPNTSNTQSRKLPILVYYHGGAFIIESAFSLTYHNFLNPLASRGGIIIISVDYRLAPEHPLPVPHNDSWEALKWVAALSDPWLAEYGDLDRMFLAGDSAGANIAHHMAVRAGGEEVKVRGLALIHPFFSAEPMNPIGAKLNSIVSQGYAGADELLSLPTAGMKAVGCRRVVVFVAERDALRERGKRYYEGLVGMEWGGEAELVEQAGESHVFHLLKPKCEGAVEMSERLVGFFNKD